MFTQSPLPASISPRSSADSGPPGAPATTRWSAPRCRSSAKCCARPSIFVATSASAADRLPVTFQEADAEALPFADGSFDVVLSTFGVMFTPDQAKAATELMRVCRPGGKIGMANWTPESFIGQLFKTIGKYVASAPGMKSPALWGNKAHLEVLFGAKASVSVESRHFVFRYKSPGHWIEIFRGYYGPVVKAFAAIDPPAREALEADLYALLDKFNVAEDSTLVIPSEYLEVVITKKT
jgi:SAM-dependent methyltransferase